MSPLDPSITIDFSAAIKSLDEKLVSLRKAKTDRRINCYTLLEELKHNDRACHMYLTFNVDLSEILPRLSRDIYDELGEAGVDLTTIKCKRIPKDDSLEGTLVSSWQRKLTVTLIRNTYDKITEIIEFYPVAPKGKINPKLRMRYIKQKLELLIKTIDCDK